MVVGENGGPRWSSRAAAFLAISLLFSLASLGSANAFNWSGASSGTGCNGGVNRQDNSSMTYYRKKLTAKMSSAVAIILANAVDPTDVFVKTEQSSQTSKTDVVYRDWDYTNYCGYGWHSPTSGGVIGLYKCVSLSGSRCQKSEARFDTSYTGLSTTTIAKAQKLACHETGHSLGLLHTVNSTTCMKQGSSVLQTGYSSHEVNDLLNPNY